MIKCWCGFVVGCVAGALIVMYSVDTNKIQTQPTNINPDDPKSIVRVDIYRHNGTIESLILPEAFHEVR